VEQALAAPEFARQRVQNAHGFGRGRWIDKINQSRPLSTHVT